MLMESMKNPPEEGDRCRVRYTGYEANGDSDMPAREDVGIFLGTKFWGGGRYQRGFDFEGRGETWIFDDHEVFECEVLERGARPVKKLKKLRARLFSMITGHRFTGLDPEAQKMSYAETFQVNRERPHIELKVYVFGELAEGVKLAHLQRALENTLTGFLVEERARGGGSYYTAVSPWPLEEEDGSG